MLSHQTRTGLALAVAIVVVDQISKAWALVTWFDPPRSIEVTPFFNLVAVLNTGVSFGFLSGDSSIMPYILAALATTIAAVLTVWLIRAPRRFVAIALGCVLGGAIGNIIDRLRFHAVIDFIDIHAAGYHWPAFNIADSAITIGVVLLIFDSFANRDTQATNGHKAGD